MGQGVGQGQEGPKVGSRTEGRVTQVVLLDDRRLEMMVQPRLYAGELLDIVASHCGLREKEYFYRKYLLFVWDILFIYL